MAQEVHADIRKVLVEMFGDSAAASVRILYGGSMKPENAAGLLAQPGVDGGLIGGASLTSRAFSGIVEANGLSGPLAVVISTEVQRSSRT